MLSGMDYNLSTLNAKGTIGYNLKGNIGKLLFILRPLMTE